MQIHKFELGTKIILAWCFLSTGLYAEVTKQVEIPTNGGKPVESFFRPVEPPGKRAAEGVEAVDLPPIPKPVFNAETLSDTLTAARAIPELAAKPPTSGEPEITVNGKPEKLSSFYDRVLKSEKYDVQMGEVTPSQLNQIIPGSSSQEGSVTTKIGNALQTATIDAIAGHHLTDTNADQYRAIKSEIDEGLRMIQSKKEGYSDNQVREAILSLAPELTNLKYKYHVDIDPGKILEAVGHFPTVEAIHSLKEQLRIYGEQLAKAKPGENSEHIKQAIRGLEVIGTDLSTHLKENPKETLTATEKWLIKDVASKLVDSEIATNPKFAAEKARIAELQKNRTPENEAKTNDDITKIRKQVEKEIEADLNKANFACLCMGMACPLNRAAPGRVTPGGTINHGTVVPLDR